VVIYTELPELHKVDREMPHTGEQEIARTPSRQREQRRHGGWQGEYEKTATGRTPGGYYPSHDGLTADEIEVGTAADDTTGRD